MKKSIALLSVLTVAAIGTALAQAPAAATSDTAPLPWTTAAQAPADRWPKTAQLDGATYTVYQPQLDSWDSFNVAAHAAVSVLPPGSQVPVSVSSS